MPDPIESAAPTDGGPSVHDRLVRHLAESGVAFREIHHEPTPTSADAARVRGEPIGSGAKALLLKADDRYMLFVLPGDRRLDSASVKRQLGLGRLRFASREELLAQTGLIPGAVPPFGRPVLPFDLTADVSVGQDYPTVAFNAGSVTDSIIMSASDWERVAKPARLRITEPQGPGGPGPTAAP
ncbi:MAG TPA: YbaK/EbsC family protein [Opitutaceae bacterium]|nr:YbaK/EbsC family protein [Opitutaceae bacterium]